MNIDIKDINIKMHKIEDKVLDQISTLKDELTGILINTEKVYDYSRTLENSLKELKDIIKVRFEAINKLKKEE